MDNKIFRKTSLDRVNSPDDINDYIKVSSPGIWLLLVGVAVLLIGVFIWGLFGTVNVFDRTVCTVDDGVGTVYFTLPTGADLTLDTGDSVSIGGILGTVTSVKDTENAGEYCLNMNVALPDGMYNAEIAVGRTKPISFIFN